MRSSATCRSQSSPAASHATAGGCARCAGSTRAPSTATATRCSRRWRRAATLPRSSSTATLAADPDAAPLVALGEALVRARAREAGLAYELIAARADLAAVVAYVRNGGPEPDTRTLQGWRRELVGEDLLDLLRGHRSLAVGEKGRLEVEPR